MIRQTTSVVVLEFAAGLALIVLFATSIFAWRLSQGPTDISFLKDRVETALIAARDGQDSEIGDLVLEWRHDRGQIQISANDVRLYSSERQIAAEAERAYFDFKLLSLLSGRIETEAIELEAGSLAIERFEDGSLRVAGELIELGTPPEGNWLEVTNTITTSLLQTVLNEISQSPLERIAFTDFSVSLTDIGTGLSWFGDSADVEILNLTDQVTLTAEGALEGLGAPEMAAIRFAADKSTAEASLTVDVTSIPIGDFARLLPPQIVLAASTTLDARVGFTANEVGLSLAESRIDIADETITVFDQVVPVTRLSLSGEIDFEADRFVATLDDIRTGLVRGGGRLSAVIGDASSFLTMPTAQPVPFTLDGRDIGVDLQPMFEAAWPSSAIAARGELDFEAGEVRVSRATVSNPDLDATAQGRFYWKGRGFDVDGALPIGISLTATADGTVQPENVLVYWPVNLGSGARNWVKDNVRSGQLQVEDFLFDLSPTSLIDGTLDNEELVLNFSFDDADVTFLSDLPAITAGEGGATLRGNSFRLDLVRGRFAGLDLSDGQVSIPYFMPEDGDIEITARGQGKGQELLKVLSNSRLQLENRYGIPVDRIEGDGQVRFAFSVPTRMRSNPRDPTFQIDATITGAEYLNLTNGLDLTEASGRLSIDEKGLQLKGFGSLSSAPVQFTWNEQFGDHSGDRTRLSATAILSPDVLNQFGIAARAYLTGETNVTFEGRGNDNFLDIADINLDLTEVRVSAPEFGWLKPKGKAADVALVYQRDGETLSVAMDLESTTADIDAAMRLDANSEKLISLRLDKAVIADRMDVRGSVERRTDGGIRLTLDGDYLNAEPFIGDIFSLGGAGESSGAPLFGKIDVSSSLNRLQLKRGLVLQNARFEASVDGPRLDEVVISGATASGARFDVVLDGAEEGRKLTLIGEDAGFLVSSLVGGDYIQGGRVEVMGNLRPRGQDSDFRVDLSDVQLQNAPVATQILSLASLQGLADVLSGEGVRFSSVTIPFTVTPDRFLITGAKASGPALGVTANGWVSLRRREMDFGGVLVPSFGVNSALGGIPIIGDLFVSRDGEGVFAITYGVRSDDEGRIQIGVNPLSAITPGVLRRIFERPDSVDLRGNANN